MSSFKSYLFLDKLLFSANEEDILKFYDHFRSSNELIKWMQKRPKQKIKIFEIQGDKDYIILVPTRDHNSRYAKECLRIYKGCHIIFLESSDVFFSYSKKCNFGFRYAIKYKPKWIILSNDDMFKIDDISKLKLQLEKIDNKKTDIVYVSPGEQCSVKSYLVSSKILYNLYRRFSSKYSMDILIILKKFNSNLFIMSMGGKDIKSLMLKMFRPLLFRTYTEFTSFGSFLVASSNFIKNKRCKIFDETFIIDSESDEIILRLLGKIRTMNVDYKIGCLIGQTLGTGHKRSLRSLTGLIYLNYLYKKHRLSV